MSRWLESNDRLCIQIVFSIVRSASANLWVWKFALLFDSGIPVGCVEERCKYTLDVLLLDTCT